MRILRDDITPEQFFSKLKEARQSLLMLDYDGTLAPLTPDRDNARPYPELLSVLGDLLHDESCRVVIVSGRPIKQLLPLLGLDPAPELWGSHGWERRHRDGSYIAPELDEETKALLDQEWEWLCSCLPLDRIERKPVSVALHWRGLDQLVQVGLHALAGKRWKKLPAALGMEIHPFSGGLELRVKGRNKGDAVRTLLSEYQMPPVSAYLGDDRTDEVAFAALGDRGLCVLVRDRLRETLADAHLVPPDEVREFLVTWRSRLQ